MPASPDGVDLRMDRRITAGSYVHDGPALATGWHSHGLHQLEYSCDGALGVETRHGRLVVWPQQVAWIPAGVRHLSTLGAARTISVFLHPDLVPAAPGRATTLPAGPLLREMIRHATRWPIARQTRDPVADAFYVTLGMMLPDWLRDPQPAPLPTSADPLISRAIGHTHDHLATITHSRLSSALGVSERTLRRRFRLETRMSWHEYVQLARLLHATGLLASTDLTVTRVAAAAGFDSPTGFARAFLQRTGETPSAYRRRVALDGET